MIQEIQPVFYANRLEETKKVFYSDDDKVYFELGLGNSFYKACYSYVLCRHFGIDAPEIKRVKKSGVAVFCQQIYSNWEEFDSTSNFNFGTRKKINQLQNPERIIRQALFDEQFMVYRQKENGYNFALIKNEKYRLISRDYYQAIHAGYLKGDLIQKSIFFKNILDYYTLEELILEIENYFSLQDSIIEEKILLLSAYLNESKYKELFLGFLQNDERNKGIRKKMLETLYLLKR